MDSLERAGLRALTIGKVYSHTENEIQARIQALPFPDVWFFSDILDHEKGDDQEWRIALFTMSRSRYFSNQKIIYEARFCLLLSVQTQNGDR